MASSAYGPESVTSVGETDIDLDAFSFLWTINNYSAIMTGLKSVDSPIFHGGGTKGNFGWKLSLHKDDDHLQFYLGLSDYGEEDDEVKVKANYQVDILGPDGRLIPTIGNNFKTAEFVKSGPLSVMRIIGFPDFADSSRKLVVDDKLKILCKIWILGGLKQTVRKGGSATLNPSDVERIRISKEGLRKDLGKLFRESVGSDVTISGFKAHKVILSVRSSVFAAMFNNNMLEKQVNVVHITDFDDEVVEGMLEYLYTGETSCMTDRASELLQIAEKYDLSGLKLDCEYVMTEKLSMENAAEILILAQTHNASYLKARAMDFINLNKEKLLKSKSFRDAVKSLADAGALVDLYLSQG